VEFRKGWEKLADAGLAQAGLAQAWRLNSTLGRTGSGSRGSCVGTSGASGKAESGDAAFRKPAGREHGDTSFRRADRIVGNPAIGNPAIGISHRIVAHEPADEPIGNLD